MILVPVQCKNSEMACCLTRSVSTLICHLQSNAQTRTRVQKSRLLRQQHFPLLPTLHMYRDPFDFHAFSKMHGARGQTGLLPRSLLMLTFCDICGGGRGNRPSGSALNFHAFWKVYMRLYMPTDVHTLALSHDRHGAKLNGRPYMCMGCRAPFRDWGSLSVILLLLLWFRQWTH